MTENLLSADNVTQNGRKLLRTRYSIAGFLGAVLLLAITFGCGPPNADTQRQSGSVSSDLPELSEETIRDRINDAWIREVPEENGTGEPISWRFYGNEPKEIAVVEKQVDGTHATIVLDIKTSSGPRTREPRYLAGQIRTIWELRSGLVLRKWDIVATENISMKYKNLPKLPDNTSSR